jgi:ribosomal protein S18 acetylase RimI-like enzyme
MAYAAAMNVTLRPIRPAELDRLHVLIRRIEEHDRLPIATSRIEVEEWRSEPRFDLASDSRLVEIDGRLVAWGRIWHQPSGQREQRAYVLGGVAPEQRGRGIGTALLQWQIDRAAELLRSAEDGLPRFVWAQAYDFQQEVRRLLVRHAMHAARYQDELLRNLADLPSLRPVPGLSIVPWDAARSEDARRAENDAFSDHWGSTPRDEVAWQHDTTRAGSRLDLSFLAMANDGVVGVCRNGHFPDDEAVTGRRDGWIMNLSVVRSHRKRGIASALVAASLDAFERAGFTHSCLGVDSENASGAYQLYERLGYRRMQRRVVHQRTA